MLLILLAMKENRILSFLGLIRPSLLSLKAQRVFNIGLLIVMLFPDQGFHSAVSIHMGRHINLQSILYGAQPLYAPGIEMDVLGQ